MKQPREQESEKTRDSSAEPSSSHDAAGGDRLQLMRMVAYRKQQSSGAPTKVHRAAKDEDDGPFPGGDPLMDESVGRRGDATEPPKGPSTEQWAEEQLRMLGTGMWGSDPRDKRYTSNLTSIRNRLTAEAPSADVSESIGALDAELTRRESEILGLASEEVQRAKPVLTEDGAGGAELREQLATMRQWQENPICHNGHAVNPRFASLAQDVQQLVEVGSVRLGRWTQAEERIEGKVPAPMPGEDPAMVRDRAIRAELAKMGVEDATAAIDRAEIAEDIQRVIAWRDTFVAIADFAGNGLGDMAAPGVGQFLGNFLGNQAANIFAGLVDAGVGAYLDAINEVVSGRGDLQSEAVRSVLDAARAFESIEDAKLAEGAAVLAKASEKMANDSDTKTQNGVNVADEYAGAIEDGATYDGMVGTLVNGCLKKPMTLGWLGDIIDVAGHASRTAKGLKAWTSLMKCITVRGEGDDAITARDDLSVQKPW